MHVHAVCRVAARAPCSPSHGPRWATSRGWSTGMPRRWPRCVVWRRSIRGTAIAVKSNGRLHSILAPCPFSTSVHASSERTEAPSVWMPRRKGIRIGIRVLRRAFRLKTVESEAWDANTFRDAGDRAEQCGRSVGDLVLNLPPDVGHRRKCGGPPGPASTS